MTSILWLLFLKYKSNVSLNLDFKQTSYYKTLDYQKNFQFLFYFQ